MGYCERLKLLDITTSETRRLWNDLIEVVTNLQCSWD